MKVKKSKYFVGYIISLVLFIFSYIAVSLPICVAFLFTGDFGDNIMSYINMLFIFLKAPFLVIVGENGVTSFGIIYASVLGVLTFLTVFFFVKDKKSRLLKSEESNGGVDNEN